MMSLPIRMSYNNGQYFHFASGRNYIVCLLSYSVPEWRNGRRRGFKIPRLHGRVSSSLTLGTILAVKECYKLSKLKAFTSLGCSLSFRLFDLNLIIILLDKKKYLVTVLVCVGSVRRGGTKGWCYCVSLFSLKFEVFFYLQNASTHNILY